ncbi:MAG: EpsG family protein [Bacteroidales bacterium]|nr:EpsG family protein [Bacteroidales bacterium]
MRNSDEELGTMNNLSLKSHKDGFSFISVLLIYLVWPALGAFYALRNYKEHWSKNVFWLFCIFFGLTFIIGTKDQTDSYYYASLFTYYAHSNIDLKGLWSSFYISGTGYDDIASPLITYLVSRISDNPIVLFTVFAAFFGYFYSRNIWYILDRINERPNGINLLFLITFLLLNPIWNINGFRFYIAAQIFIFGVLPYLIEGKSSKLLWAGIAIFFHFSFLFAFGVLLIFFVFKNRLHAYMFFFVAMAFIKEIDLLLIQSTLEFLPEIFYTSVINYTNADYIEALNLERQLLNWYVPFSINAVRWVIYAFVLIIYFFGRESLHERKELHTLLCFSLLFYGCASLFSLIPIGNRFITVASVFMFAFFILFLDAVPSVKGVVILKIFSTPLLIIFSIVALRTGMDFYGIKTLLGNPIMVLIDPAHTSLIALIKSII